MKVIKIEASIFIPYFISRSGGSLKVDGKINKWLDLGANLNFQNRW